MRNLAFLLGGVAIVLCGGARAARAQPIAPACGDDSAPYAPARLRERIAYLASPELDGRVPGTAGDHAARAYVIEQLRCLGVAPAADGGDFEQAFTADGATTANLVGMIAGSAPGELVVVGAHLDHLGSGKLGANDNASGVAGLLAIAAAVHAHGQPRRTIVFAIWGGEEPGLLGSEFFVAHPPATVPLDHVVEYVNLDMIGSYNARHAVYAFGATTKVAAHAILDKLARGHRKLNVGLGGHSERGDQLGFCEHAIPYVFLWTPDPRCYHETCDTVEHVDVAHAAEIAQLAGDFVLALADTDVDLAAARARTGCGAPTH